MQPPNKKGPFKPMLSHITDFNGRSEKYTAYVKKVEQSRFTTGFDIVDKDIRGIAAGEMMIISAYSGTFKSAYLQNILMGYSSRSGLYSLFFSLEMPNEKVYEREMQIANSITSKEVEHRALNVHQRTLDQLNKCRTSGASKVLTVERPKLTLEHIAEYIELAKVKYELGVVGIDYLGLMKGGAGRSSADLTEDLSNGAKELAKEANLPVILLTQIYRAAARAQSDEGSEIELHHLKYGGEAGADIVLGLYRDQEESLVLKILKNRGGVINKRYKAEIIPHAMRFEGFSDYIPPPKKRGGYKKQQQDDLPI